MVATEEHRYTTWFVHDNFSVCVTNFALDSKFASDYAESVITEELGGWVATRANDIITEDA